MLTKKTILLVEDEALIAMEEKMTLEKYGYRVITKYSGENAVEYVENNSEIDLILMDIDLGSGMDGTEAAEKILGMYDLPLVFLSSHTEREVVEKTEGITSYGYIVKASGETVLIASVKMALKLFDAEQETQRHATRNEAIVRALPDLMFVIDKDGYYIEVHSPDDSLLPLAAEEVIGKKIDLVFGKEEADRHRQYFRKCLETGENQTYDYKLDIDDQRHYFEARITKFDQNSVLAISHEITNRKEAKQKIDNLNSLLMAIRNVNQIIVQEDNLMQMMQNACQALLDTRQYLNFEIALLDESKGTISPIAAAGEHQLGDWQISEDDYNNALKCVRELVTSRESIIINNPQEYCKECPQMDEYGFHKTILIPMIKNNELVGVLIACMIPDHGISSEEIDLLQEVADDLAFAREKIKAEDALRESEERFRIAQEMSPDGFTIMHPVRNENGEIVDFTWIYENQTIARINGTDPQKVIGKRLLDLLPSHSETSVFKAYLQVANTGESRILEEVYVEEILSKPTWLRLVVVSMGEDIAILAQDITERKQAEETLRKTKYMVDKSPLSVFWISPEGKFTYANETAAEKLGYSLEELMSMHVWDVDPNYPREKRKEQWNMYQEEKELKFESEHRRRDGTTFPVRINSYYLAFEDQEMEIAEVEDITERKKREKVLQEIIDKNPLSIQILDKNGYTIKTNPAHTRLFSAKPPPDWNFFTDQQIEQQVYKQQIDQLQKGEVANLPDCIYNAHYINPEFPDKPIWIKGIAFPLFDNSGDIERYVLMHEDITERKRIEQELTEQKELLSAIYRNAPLMMMVVNNERRLQQVNGLATQFANRDAGEMLGLRGGEALRCMHVLDDPRGCGFGEFCQQCVIRNTVLDTLETGETHLQMEAPYYFKADENQIKEMTLLASTTPIMVKGKRMVLVTLQDITERKQAEEKLRESKASVRKKLQAIMEPDIDIGILNLADIIDAEDLQTMMEDFYKTTQIGGAILDISGNVLVGVGWQDICTKYHRVHPDTAKNCLESDLALANGIPVGTFKAYLCKNNMWDMVSPIEIGGKHLGNIYIGQFFYEDEQVDYELFRKQARQHGFDETEYMAALDCVPRFNREKIESAMMFYAKLAEMISSLSYSKIELSRNIVQQERAEERLRQSEELFRNLYENATIGIYRTTPEGKILMANQTLIEMLGYASFEDLADRNLAQGFYESDYPREKFVERIEQDGCVKGLESVWKLQDGRRIHVLESARLIKDEHGRSLFYEGTIEDITELKTKEQMLQKRLQYEKIVSKVSSLTVEVDDLRNFFEQCITIIGETINLSYCYMFEYDSAKESLENTVEWCAADVPPQKDKLQSIPVDAVNWWYQELKEGRNICFSDIEDIPDDNAKEILQSQGILSILVVPLFVNNKFYGYIGLKECKTHRAWPQEDVELLTSVVKIIEGTIKHQNADKKLIRKNILLKNITDNMFDLVALTDFEGNFSFLSRSYRIFDYPINELLSKNILDLIHPDDQVYVKQMMEAGISERESRRLECRCRCADGSYIWLENLGKFFRDETGKPQGLIISSRDITDRKSSENMMQKEIDAQTKLLEFTEDFLGDHQKALDYQKITDNVLKISGAKYAVFNLFEENGKDFRTVALAGIKDHILKASKILGLKLIGKKWSYDKQREQKTIGKTISKFSALSELTDKVLPKQIVSSLEKQFDIGETIVAKITTRGKTLGDFTIMMPKGEKFTEDKIMEIYLRQIGLLMQHHKAEDKVQQSKRSFQNIFNNSSVAIYIQDREGRFIDINPAAVKLYGYDKDYLIGRSPECVTAPEKNDMNQVKQKIEKAFEGEPQQFEFWAKRKDGTVFPKIVTVEKGTYFSEDVIFAYAIDISERKQAQEELMQKNELLKNITDNMFDLVALADLGGNFIFVGKSHEQLGYPQHELIGRNVMEFVHPNDLDRIKAVFEKTLLTKESKSLEYRYRCADGSYVWLETIGKILLDDCNQPKEILFSSRDVTERKKAEKALKEQGQNYKAIINAMNDMVYVIGFDGMILDVNQKTMEIMGYTKEELLSMTPSEFDDHLSDKEIKNLIDNVSIDRIQVFETKHKTKNGIIIPIEISSSIVFYQGEQAVLSIARDITDRKQTEHELMESEERAHSQREAISKLVLDESIAMAELPEAFKKITKTLTKAIEVERASIWLLSDHKKQLRCLSLYEASRDKHTDGEVLETAIFPNYFKALLSDSRIVTEDAIHDPRTCELEGNYLYKSGISSMIDAAIQLEGDIVGVVSIEHVGEKRQWHSDEEAFVSTVAAMVAQILTNVQRHEAEDKIKKQLSEKETLLKEVHHRIKNNLASVASLLSLQANSVSNPEAESILKEAIGRVKSMRILYDKLLITEGHEDVSVRHYLEDLISLIISTTKEESDFKLEMEIDDIPLDVKKLFPIGVIVNELLTNIIKYAFQNSEAGLVIIKLKQENDKVRLIVQDNGVGLSEDFDVEKSEGFGLMLVKILAEQLGGSLSFTNKQGTKAMIEFSIDK
jgi:PAS domain S-box-containing protein